MASISPSFGSVAKGKQHSHNFNVCVQVARAEDHWAKAAGKATTTPDLVEKPWKYGTAQKEVERVIRKGVGKMPKYEGKLSEKEIEAVAACTRKLAGVDGQQQDDCGRRFCNPKNYPEVLRVSCFLEAGDHLRIAGKITQSK